MRILLSKNSRKKLFQLLMEVNRVPTLRDLAVKLNLPYKTVRNWRDDLKKYLPDNLLNNFYKDLEILDIQPDNWGQRKGGKNGINKKIKNLRRLWADSKFSNLRKEIGKKNINLLNQRIKADEEFKKQIFRKTKNSKEKKRISKSKFLELKNKHYFINKQITFDISQIKFSKFDRIKNIKLPVEMTPELAEETGVHLGDGGLSLNKNYFSVKTNKKERDYMVNFLFPLYKKLYGLNLKLMELESVVGFEIYSQALLEFKNKILNIPIGNKVNRIRVPSAILESKNREIYSSFIRGIFDTDGCVYLNKSKNNYSTISFTIKSESFIKDVSTMLEKMGFIHYLGKYRIDLNGYIMLKKWIEEIGSNNSKNIARLQQASSSTRIE